MNIIYIITILVIYALFMLLHKTEKKQNLILWLAITATIILCYNIFICVIFSFINILCTLQNLSIVNGILILALSAIILKNKKIQKYKACKTDTIIVVALFLIVIIAAYKQYGFPFKIKYEITDASTHYYYAEQFYKESELLYKGRGNDIFGLYDSDFRLPGAYINEGILFKVFDNIVSRINLFILFDLFILYLSGILFYGLLKTYVVKENKKLKIIAIIISIMYMLGYQLNSVLYGYVYLTLALEIIVGFLLMYLSYEKEQIKDTVALPILALLSFGIFFSYAYFIPIIFIAIIIDMIIKSKINNEKIFSDSNLIKTLLIIVNPLILGITYFVALPGAKGIENELSTLILEGAIYKNYITNLIAFIPIFALGTKLIIEKREKEFDLGTILLAISILFVIILFIANKFEIVSKYYCFKAYYIIWPLALYSLNIMLSKILESTNPKDIKLLNIYSVIYIVAIITCTLFRTDIGINNIFYHNLNIIQDKRDILKYEELQMIEAVRKSKEKPEVYVLTSKYEGRMKWMAILFDKKVIYLDAINGYEITIDQWLEEKENKYYLAYYKDYEMTEEKMANIDENSEKYDIIYKNEYGFILERK